MTESGEGTPVRVYDTARKRWYKGHILYVVRLDDRDQPDAWMVELLNGNRGCYDINHIEITLHD